MMLLGVEGVVRKAERPKMGVDWGFVDVALRLQLLKMMMMLFCCCWNCWKRNCYWCTSVVDAIDVVPKAESSFGLGKEMAIWPLL